MSPQNGMPELPKKHRTKEADFGTHVFRPWVLANAPDLFSCTFEVKQTSKDSIAFSCVEEAQVDASLTITEGENGYLIRNQSGTIGAPDYSYYKQAPAFIVIKYPDFFCIIDINFFLYERNQSKRKSLTSERAQSIAWKTIKV